MVQFNAPAAGNRPPPVANGPRMQSSSRNRSFKPDLAGASPAAAAIVLDLRCKKWDDFGIVDKRYQVFVSSTYIDLQEERAEVMQALLELDCMPSGMEIFPAANETQWNWIKRVIQESDYYIVIVGGRYGSVSSQTGLSYTEMEYRFAVEMEKPVIAFLHEDISKIISGKSESDRDLKSKLDAFRKLVQTRLCKHYSNPSDLGAKVSRSITQLIKLHPAVGWVRADSALSAETTGEILSLRREIEILNAKLKRVSTESLKGAKGSWEGRIVFH
jgi:hypothetical protein